MFPGKLLQHGPFFRVFQQMILHMLDFFRYAFGDIFPVPARADTGLSSLFLTAY